MSWVLALSGRTDECHQQINERADTAKSSVRTTEREHIDVAVDIFHRLVPSDSRVSCIFSVAGNSSGPNDIVLNYSLTVYPS